MKKVWPWFGAYLVILALCFAVNGVYYLVAGKWQESTFPMMISMPLAFLTMGYWAQQRTPSEELVNQPELETALHSLGFSKAHVFLLRGSEHPKPICMNGRVTIPERVLRDYSAPALLWAVKTEYSAAILEIKSVVAWLLLPIIGLLVGMGLVERYHASGWWMLFPGALLVVGWTVGFRVSTKNVENCDLRFTTSEEDRLAAKEALSLPYFDQLKRGPSKKWLFTASTYAARAKNLGITLEEGYRVPGAEGNRVGQ